jgi:hypothetical protein
MPLQLYDLDRRAHDLVLAALNSEVAARNSEDQTDKKVLNEAHKMRATVAYGLERFWGEHIRLLGNSPAKSNFWKQTWDELASILCMISNIQLPNNTIGADDTNGIRIATDQLWDTLSNEDRKLAQAVLTQLCDSIVWWTQRYKKVGNRDDDD